MTAPILPPAQFAEIAAKERARRNAAWAREVAAGRVARDRMEADDRLWLAIEALCRRGAGEPTDGEIPEPALDDPLRVAMADSARKTLLAACKSLSGDTSRAACATLHDLRALHFFLAYPLLYGLRRRESAGRRSGN